MFDLLLSFWDETLHQASLLLPVLLTPRTWHDHLFNFLVFFWYKISKNVFGLLLGINAKHQAKPSKLCKFMTTIWEFLSNMSMIVLYSFYSPAEPVALWIFMPEARMISKSSNLAAKAQCWLFNSMLNQQKNV